MLNQRRLLLRVRQHGQRHRDEQQPEPTIGTQNPHGIAHRRRRPSTDVIALGCIVENQRNRDTERRVRGSRHPERRRHGRQTKREPGEWPDGAADVDQEVAGVERAVAPALFVDVVGNHGLARRFDDRP